MNISTNSHLVHPAENPYHQFRPLAGLNPSKNTNNTVVKNAGATHTGIKAVVPTDILSVREKETLQALFQSDSRENTFYGATKVGNIQSGFLLDIKG